METISLFDLANLAISKPEVGIINFPALHALLQGILSQLKIKDVTVQYLNIHQANRKSVQDGSSSPVKELWDVTKIRSTLDLHEEGVCKAMAVLQDLMLEINNMKESQSQIQDQIQKVTENAGLENLKQLHQDELKTETDKDVDNLKKELELLKSRLKNLEDKVELLCETLTTHPRAQDAPASSSFKTSDYDITCVSGPAQVTEISVIGEPIITTSQSALSQTQSTSHAEDSAPHDDIPHASQDGVTANTLDNTQPEVSGQPHDMHVTYPESFMPQTTGIDLSMTSMDNTAAPESSRVTTAYQSGATSKDHAMLYTRVDALERDKADRTELGLLQRNTDDLAKTLPDLQEKLSCLNKEMQDLRGHKLEQLQRSVDPVVTLTDQKVDDDNKINQQLEYLNATIQAIEKELKVLRGRQEQEKAIMEQSVSQKSSQLQDQLDTLRGILTTMASSSSTLLAMSIPEQSVGSTPALAVTAETELPALSTTQAPATASASKEHLTCPACTIDIGQKVSNLVTQYENLQKLVTDFASKEVVSKDLLERRMASDPHLQDNDLIGYIKNTMAQLQEECEHLNKTTKSLIQEDDNKQKHIDILYQAVSKLENKKADKEMIGLEVDVKADKNALDRKVSRTHFDATIELLSKMMQDLLGKVSAQEQDWQKLLEKINLEMQNKLDRIEIDSLKTNLEERWKDLSQQLQQRPPNYVADEAAGIRKQLMTTFHCISCDRSVQRMVPGPVISTLPKFPGLPVRHSNRPHIVLELGKVRQQTSRLKSRIAQARSEASQLDMSINHLRRTHTQLCQEITRVQLHFSGSDKPSKKIINHLQQAHCVILGKYSKKSSSIQGLDHLPDLGCFTSISSHRSCGGHTLTSDSKKPNNPFKKATGACLKEEIFIWGHNMPIYQGSKVLQNRYQRLQAPHIKKPSAVKNTKNE